MDAERQHLRDAHEEDCMSARAVWLVVVLHFACVVVEAFSAIRSALRNDTRKKLKNERRRWQKAPGKRGHA